MNLPPGPRWTGSLANILAMRRDPLGLLGRLADEYGPLVRVPMVENFMFVSHPDGIKHVLQDNHANYLKGSPYRRLKAVLGEGLVTSEGDFWLRQRRLAQPAFARRQIAAFVDTFVQRSREMLDGWSDEIDITREAVHLTLAIAGDTFFSVDLGPEAERVGEALREASEITHKRLFLPFFLPRPLPTRDNIRLEAAVKSLDDIVWRVIRARRARPDKIDDLLGRFMEAVDEETGERMDDVQLRDEAITMMLAGHETTANLLSWTCWLLAIHPEIQARAREEASGVLAGRAPTFDDLHRLPYLLGVLQETLRLYPPAWIMSRKAVEDDTLLGYSVPAGTSVLLSPYITQRDPRWWRDPERFDPTRFDPARMERRPKLAWLAFAAGPRQCIGNNFALLEAQVAMAMILAEFELEAVEEHPVVPTPHVTLYPRHGIRLRVRPRATIPA
jgi:cytochrome P450